MDARILCGYDVRRSGMWPTDEARIEAFIGQYGGTLEAAPVGDAAIMLRWQSDTGATHMVTGVTASDALTRLTNICNTTSV